MSELIEKQKVLDALREIATEKFSLDDPYGVYINVLMDVEEKICHLPVVQPNGPDNLVKDSQGLAKELVNDCISRHGVSAWLANMGYRGLSNKVMDEDRFPSVQPKSYREGYQAGFKDAQSERKRGRWEYVDYGGFGNWHCTVCGKICICNGDFDFCPNCGADMREVDE